MRCTCEQGEVAHHHAFGGTYPCSRPDDCRRCADEDARVWNDRPLPVANRSSLRAARRRHITKER